MKTFYFCLFLNLFVYNELKENVCIIISRGNTMAELKLENIYKIYDNNVTAVTDFNLHIQDKEFIVFVGPSGCGKSTTLRMVAGLEDISKGEFSIDGKLMNDVLQKIAISQWSSKTMPYIHI